MAPRADGYVPRIKTAGCLTHRQSYRPRYPSRVSGRQRYAAARSGHPSKPRFERDGSGRGAGAGLDLNGSALSAAGAGLYRDVATIEIGTGAAADFD